MIPPAIMHIHVVDRGKKRIGLWLPIFLLWPVLLVLVVVAVPLIIIAQVILACLRIPIRLVSIFIAVVSVITSMRGLKVDVGQKSNNQSSVLINII